MPSPLSRRKLLAAAGTALAASALGKNASADAGVPAPSRELTAEQVAAAEKLLGVEYTPAERAQLLETLVDQRAMAVVRRASPLPNALAPATRFDPRLPQDRTPTGKDRFRSAFTSTPAMPADDEALAFAPVWQQAAWIRSRRLSSERLTRIYLDRLERFGPKLECVATLTRDHALAAARRADAELKAGRYRGPLHGIPYGAKDLLDTAGIPTTWGAEPFASRVPADDAWVISKLATAGAVLVAKTTLGALAYGDIWAEGKTRNPWWLAEGSSGSSAGSASATAAGLMSFGIGSETLGSIVSPSMRCGTTGLRPTFGRVPRTGAMALCWSLDKLGPICRTVEDTALVLSVLNGFDPQDAGSLRASFQYDGRAPLKSLKVGYVPAHFAEETATSTDRDALSALKKLGVQLVELELPKLSAWTLLPILLAESAAAFEELTLTGKDDQLDWQEPAAWPNSFRAARFLSAVDLVQADRARRRLMEQLAAVFQQVDVIAGPSFAGELLTATNFTGHPSLTLRAGFVELDKPRGFGAGTGAVATGESRRVPHGFTLWGRLFDEGRLCALGVALERALDVWHQRPPIA